MSHGPSNFVSYVFVFLIGMIVSFVILLGSSILRDSYSSENHIERISLVLQAMEQDLLRMEGQVSQTQLQLNSLQNKVSVQDHGISENNGENGQEISSPSDSQESRITSSSATLTFLVLSARDQSVQTAALRVQATKGTGEVQIRNNPFLSDDILAHAKVASKVASSISKIPREDMNIVFEFSGPSQLLEDDSLGALMAIGAYAAMDNLKVKQSSLLSGAILADGRIGPVGNIFQKAEEAAKSGYTRFVIPKGQSRVTVYTDDTGRIYTHFEEGRKAKVLNLVDYSRQEWDLEIVEIETAYDAIPYLLD